jgi:hypothetical protein
LNLLLLAPVFMVVGAWLLVAGLTMRLRRRERELPPTRHPRRVKILDNQR